MSVVMSLPTNCISSFNRLSSHRLLAGIPYQFSPVEISTSKQGWFYLANQGMQSSIIRHDVRRSKNYVVMGEHLLDNVLLGDLPPSTPNFSFWASCVLGSMVTLTLTFWKIKDKVQKVEEKVEDVVEIVEEVAEEVEKVSSNLGDTITKDGILKDAISWVEKASKEVGDRSRQMLSLFHKVDEIKEEVAKDLKPLLEHHQNDGEREEQDSHGGKEKGGEEIPGRNENEEKQTKEVKNEREK